MLVAASTLRPMTTSVVSSLSRREYLDGQRGLSGSAVAQSKHGSRPLGPRGSTSRQVSPRRPIPRNARPAPSTRRRRTASSRRAASPGSRRSTWRPRRTTRGRATAVTGRQPAAPATSSPWTPCSCNGCTCCSSSSCTTDECISRVSPPTPPVPGSPNKPATSSLRSMRRPPPSGSCSTTVTASSPEPSTTCGTGSVRRSFARRSRRRTPTPSPSPSAGLAPCAGECLDHLLITGRRHLLRVLHGYVQHNRHRPTAASTCRPLSSQRAKPSRDRQPPSRSTAATSSAA